MRAVREETAMKRRTFRTLGGCSILVLAAAVSASLFLVPSNIDPDHKFSWSENAGWMNWADANAGADGVFVDTDHLSGYIWMENAGWLNVGDGAAPYANTDGTDFGVNILGGGDLDGMAWGENIGWVNFGWAASTGNPDRARFDEGAGRFHGYARAENIGWVNLDDATHFVATAPAAETLEPCPNDFTLAPNGAGGERLSRFGCVASPDPQAAAGGGTAVRVVFRTLYNTSPGDPDGASQCIARSLLTSPPPSLSQFEGQTRWLGAPVEIVDEAAPTPPNYIGAPLACMAAEAELRDWSGAGLETSFGGDADSSRIYFFDTAVVPCSVYEVSHCADPLNQATCSAPVLIFTSRMADAWPPFAPAPGQPSFTDINTHVNKYKGIPFTPGNPPLGGAPEWHTLEKGNVVADYNVSVANKKVGFLDIGVAVDGYKSIPYKEQGPCDPDAGMDNCGNACSPLP
jgi:hypothetical protein